ncbi:MAG: hypothetical protein H6Q21_30, partial [Bacteroidetes bacterium]|nr:hypothetical protein [Bacteroidota bacterium]
MYIKTVTLLFSPSVNQFQGFTAQAWILQFVD